jgi:hypothetical protein
LGPMRDLKNTVRKFLEANDLQSVVSLVNENRRVLSHLIRMAYDKETLVGWRAIKAIGFAARSLMDTDYDFLRETIRKLLWSLSDESGGIGWAAPEILGEIVSADPDRFGDIIPLLVEVFDIEEKVFRPGVMYALSRVAETAPEKIAPYGDIVIASLEDENPLLQVYALELVERLQVKGLTSIFGVECGNKITNVINGIINNRNVAWIYLDNDFKGLEVGEMSKNISKIVS